MQLGERGGQVERPVAGGPDVLDGRGRPGELPRGGGGEDGDPCGGVGEQGDVGREVEAGGDEARERLHCQPPRCSQPQVRLVAHEPAVALGAHRACAHEHGVDGGAQRVEELAVGAVADRPGAPPDGDPPVCGGGHVEQDQGPSTRRVCRRELPQRQLLDDLLGGEGLGRADRSRETLAFGSHPRFGQQPLEWGGSGGAFTVTGIQQLSEQNGRRTCYRRFRWASENGWLK